MPVTLLDEYTGITQVPVTLLNEYTGISASQTTIYTGNTTFTKDTGITVYTEYTSMAEG